MKNHPLLTKEIIAIIAITILATAAILKGINSGIIVGSVTAIAGLGGYILGKTTKTKQ